ncbi:hypothetical protein [Desulfosarcina sp. BuS5]|uniref:hypothetical protein n=1 Tax=Desulfosarcina sp. BuS5 TaxID=933262 RepID=UPI0018DC5709|nr:hypothetical protein [Desulfosarcina sp. BuS5]
MGCGQSPPEHHYIRSPFNFKEDGILIIKAERFRTQALNRQDAINRLTGLIREALKEPKIRRKTKPSVSSKRRMLDGKRHRSNLKKLRKLAQTTDD